MADLTLTNKNPSKIPGNTRGRSISMMKSDPFLCITSPASIRLLDSESKDIDIVLLAYPSLPIVYPSISIIGESAIRKPVNLLLYSDKKLIPIIMFDIAKASMIIRLSNLLEKLLDSLAL